VAAQRDESVRDSYRESACKLSYNIDGNDILVSAILSTRGHYKAMPSTPSDLLALSERLCCAILSDSDIEEVIITGLKIIIA